MSNLEPRANPINDQHGGDLEGAALHYGIERSQWLDLSTGIAPWCYPDLEVPAAVWQRLPYHNDDLLQAAATYYQCPVDCLTAVAGSQQAITAIPEMFIAPCRVAIPELGYFEHRKSWTDAGHEVISYVDKDLSALVENHAVDVVVVINPNNPTAALWSKSSLLALHQLLRRRGGCLIVDEAFADLTPQQSLADQCPATGLMVLRSVGKFFGLAGVRLGFLLSDKNLQDALQSRVPCWNVSGPAQYIGTKMLNDVEWQASQRARIESRAHALERSLRQRLAGVDDLDVSSAGLFVRVFCKRESGELMFQHLARQGILIRRFEIPPQGYCLRFGLPKNTSELQRLMEALGEDFK